MIERSPITGDPVIIAPGRSGRPNIYRNADEACPFCPGNESLTPPEIWRDAEPWRIRVFPNKYPATDRHEVIVESSRHDDTFDRLQHASIVVDAYVERYHAVSRDAAYVSLFKNHGATAGASIPHLHSQILAVPFVPPRVMHEAAAFDRDCQLCAGSDAPVIEESPNYRWITPRGATFAYEQWIVPLRHEPEIREPLELSELLRKSSRAMLRLADSFNWIFMNFPRTPNAHWYVQLFPRFAVHAGFELGTGSAINTVDAEQARKRIRDEA